MSDLYDADILAWSEQQAELLRRYGQTRNPPAYMTSNEIGPDWLNIAEEIESVGKSELRACRSLLTQAMLRKLKIDAWPRSLAVPGWTTEVIQRRQDAHDAFSPSMRDKIDVAELYARALRLLPATIDGLPPMPVPATCPWTLDEVLAEP
jgi:Domain of unknown function DUF29